ncbi:MAG: glycosyltransferase family 25 protein, partial [Candidatus Fonsibacter ubiquis]
MRVLNDYFEKIYCINLDKRPDRWESAKKEFLKHNINVERYSAVDGKFVKNLYGLKSGE